MNNPQLKHRLFRLISRAAFGAYKRLPVFGPLRGSIAVIRDGERYLVIDRSDGRGLSMAGGIAYPWESDEAALAREIQEETGLSVSECKLSLRYFSSAEIPCHVSAYDAHVAGQLRGSWEGNPVWVTLTDLQARIMASQRPLVEHLARASS